MSTLALPNQFIPPDPQIAHGVGCDVIMEGQSFSGQIIALRKNSLHIILSTPLFGRHDSTRVLVRSRNGRPLSLAGRVMGQRQIGVGQMLVVIQLANLPSESAMTPHERRLITLLRHVHRPRGRSPWTGWCLDRVRELADYVLAPYQDRRVIPRLAIRTNCAILSADTLRQGMTRDLSYTGASVLFSDFFDADLSGAVLRIKFVTLKAMPVDIAREGRNTVVRFRISSIHEGERRWRDLHYSYWQHLS